MTEKIDHVKACIDRSKSMFDQSRDTVGKIYRDAQLAHDGYNIAIGDMGNEMMKGWIDDVNNALQRKCDHPYYLTVYERKDMQMPSAINRELIYTDYRPWPESNTVVFWKNPKNQELRLCWTLPHVSEMNLIMMNFLAYDKDLIEQIEAWRDFKMESFGFVKDSKEKSGWKPNPKHKYTLIDKPSK
jgi:hypothetical protein